MSTKKAKELKRICQETREWLFSNDIKAFAGQYGISTRAVNALLSGRFLGKRTIDRLKEMHAKAIQNKRDLENTRIEPISANA